MDSIIEARFWSGVERSDGCWEWQRGRSKGGYGQIWVKPVVLYTHRLSWELHFGPIPAGLLVCHHCDNRRCVRPDHLFLGTIADNANDAMAKGRAALGVRLPQTKLTDAEVLAIRGLAGTMSQEAIGRQFGVRQGAISRIITRTRRTRIA